MAECQCRELFAPGGEKRTGADHEPACAQLGQLCKDCIKVALRAGIQDMEFQPEAAGRRL